MYESPHKKGRLLQYPNNYRFFVGLKPQGCSWDISLPAMNGGAADMLFNGL
jgi:hypothetical protein